MQNYNGIKIPIKVSSQFILAKDNYETKPKFRKEYQLVVSSLIYIILGIRFNLVFIILIIFYFSLNSIEVYIAAIKRIFKYVKYTLYIGLVFRGSF